jgi:hypothetical protein
LFPADSGIIADDNHLHLAASRLGFLHSHSKIQHIAGVIHYDNEHASLAIDALEDTPPDLLRGWAREDGPGYASAEHSRSDKSSKGGLVTGAASGDDSDLRLMVRSGVGWVNGIGPSVHNLVDGVECRVGIGQGDTFERTGNEMRRIVNEVIGYM